MKNSGKNSGSGNGELRVAISCDGRGISCQVLEAVVL